VLRREKFQINADGSFLSSDQNGECILLIVCIYIKKSLIRLMNIETIMCVYGGVEKGLDYFMCTLSNASTMGPIPLTS